MLRMKASDAPRRRWHELPATVRAAVETRTGLVEQSLPVAAGFTSDLVAVLGTSTGRYFCKGVSEDNPLGWMHRNEARINPYLPAGVPRLRWEVELDGWQLLGFEYVEGRHPDLAAGSPDLPLMADTLTAMAATPAQCPVQPAIKRWAGYIAPELIDGDTLLHTDVTPRNFLIRPDSTVTVVDWAMPCRGAAWIDTALMVVRLIRAGHTPTQAQEWAGRVPAWAAASPDAVDAFAAGLATLAHERRQQSRAEHLGPLADAAGAWAAHRHP